LYKILGLLFEHCYFPKYKQKRLYRGIELDFKKYPQYTMQINEEKIISLDTFSSTSKDHDSSFKKNSKFIFVDAKGLNLNGLETKQINKSYKEEKEVLLAPGRFRIKYLGKSSKYEYKEDGAKNEVIFNEEQHIYELYPLELESKARTDELEIEDIEFKYQEESNKKQIVRVGDVHSSIEQIIGPLIKKGIGTYTENIICFDTKELKEVEISKIKEDKERYILLPEIVLNEMPANVEIIYMGDVIDHKTKEESKRAFYLLTYLLKKQQAMQKKNPNYKVLSYIMGNHELRIFYTTPIGKWHLEGDDKLREQIFNTIKELVKEGLMTAWEVRNNILHTHAPLGIEFLKELKKELEENRNKIISKLEYSKKETEKILEAINYFIEKKSRFKKYIAR
jgi:hypothetical protein